MAVNIDRRAIPAAAKEAWWAARDGHAVRRIDWQPAPEGAAVRGSLLFMPGRGDFYEKYLETLDHWHRQGWRVIVYCQAEGTGPIVEDTWRGLERVTIPEPRAGWLGTASFDRASIAHTLKHAAPDEVCLTFGYNTGVFNIAQRLRRLPNVINMDGMEWTRARWGLLRQGILLAN